MIEAVALVTAPASTFVAAAVQVGLAQADGFTFDGLITEPPNLAIAIAPKTALQVFYKVLILLGDRNYSAHGCKSPFRRFRFLLGSQNLLTPSCFYTQEFTSPLIGESVRD